MNKEIFWTWGRLLIYLVYAPFDAVLREVIKGFDCLQVLSPSSVICCRLIFYNLDDRRQEFWVICFHVWFSCLSAIESVQILCYSWTFIADLDQFMAKVLASLLFPFRIWFQPADKFHICLLLICILNWNHVLFIANFNGQNVLK